MKTDKFNKIKIPLTNYISEITESTSRGQLTIAESKNIKKRLFNYA